MRQVRFVEQDREPGKDQLGAALLHMGSICLDRNELRSRALMVWLTGGADGEAVRLGTLHDLQVLIVHHVFRPDDSLQTLDVGSLLPAHATALGKVLLAHHPFALGEVSRLGLRSFTDATICDPDRLAAGVGPGRRARLGGRDR